MKINEISTSTSFGQALPTCRKTEFTKTIKEAKKVLGIDTGRSMLKIHSASMPYQKVFDSGVGKLNSQPALDFIKFMAFYTDVNAIKDFPQGQTTVNSLRYYGPYTKTALTFGEENINLLNLVEDKETYGTILEMADIKPFRDNKNSPEYINYEMELGVDDNYPINKPLKVAFENFKKGLAPDALAKEFEEFKKKPLVENNYTRLALYPFIAKKEKSLFVNFDKSPQKQEKFEQYKEKYANEIEFFKFRQFLAKKEHDNAKNKINAEGIDLFGDCLIGFARQDIWAFPDAFEKGACIGVFEWGLPALDFKKILEPNSESNKLFNDKISFFLENYDGIRFDVGWCYAIAQTGKQGKEPVQTDLGHKLFDFIESRAKEIKGDDFNTKNLMYEMDGFWKMFTGWENNDPKVIPNLRNTVSILTTEYQHQKDKVGYGYPEFYKRTGLTEDELMIGTNNHDGAPLRALAEGSRPEYVERVKDNAKVLSKQMGFSAKKLLERPSEFVKAKFAQIFTVKNQFMFFVDVLGSSRQMDDHDSGGRHYRIRVSEDFERQYHTALQEGFGFNLPEALKIAMKSKGLDKNNKEIYDKLTEFAKYLRKPGAKTEAEANQISSIL